MMRVRSMRMLAVSALLCSVGGVPVGAAGGQGHSASRAGVTVRVDRRAYAGEAPVKVSIQNGLREKVSLHGCASYSIQRFVDDRYVPLTPRRCEWEMDAVSLPPGEKSFEFSPPVDVQSTYRVVVTYGTGCRDGVPLSRAQCARIDTAYSAPFVVQGAVEQ